MPLPGNSLPSGFALPGTPPVHETVTQQGHGVSVDKSSPIRRPVSGKTLVEYLEENSPDVAEQLSRVIIDTKRNYHDSHYARKHPTLAGRRW